MSNFGMCQFPSTGILHFYGSLPAPAKIKAFQTHFCRYLSEYSDILYFRPVFLSFQKLYLKIQSSLLPHVHYIIPQPLITPHIFYRFNNCLITAYGIHCYDRAGQFNQFNFHSITIQISDNTMYFCYTELTHRSCTG